MAPSVARRKPRRCARACALAVVCALVLARTFGSVGTRTDAWFGASTRDDAGARAVDGEHLERVLPQLMLDFAG